MGRDLEKINMEITLTEFKDYIPSVNLTDPQIERYLKDSKRAVERDFPVSHPEFDELQRLYALGLMQEDKINGVRSSTGNVPEGISSIGVAGVSVGFQSPTSVLRNTDGKTGYFIDYDNLKRKLLRYKGRIA
jgi:hypothetical protein